MQVVRPCRRARNVKTLPKYRDFLWLGKKAAKRKVSGPHQGGLDSGGHAYVYIYIVHAYIARCCMILQYFPSKYLLFKFRIIFISSAPLIDMLETPPHPQQAKSSCQAQGLLRPSPDVDLRVGGVEPFGWLVTDEWQDRRFFSSYRKTIQPHNPCKLGPALAKPPESTSRKTNYAYYAAVQCRCYSTPSCYPQPSCLSETFLMLVCFRHKQR